MNSQTFIFVHDQKIILDYIRVDKFKKIPNLTFVFVGNADTSKIKDVSSVIIAKDLPYNIEQYPNLTSFTGWYAIWKNNLINSDYINLFEYDINLHDDFLKIQNQYINNYDVIGYIPLKTHHYNFIQHSIWSDDLIKSIKNIYNIDTKNLILNQEEKICSMTSNHTFKTDTYYKYMKWVEPMINDIKNSFYSGHQIERSISLFYLLKNIKYHVIPNILIHFQFDSHKTQGISEEKFKSNYNKLLNI